MSVQHTIRFTIGDIQTVEELPENVGIATTDTDSAMTFLIFGTEKAARDWQRANRRRYPDTVYEKRG
jgi:hypothetical protein